MLGKLADSVQGWYSRCIREEKYWSKSPLEGCNRRFDTVPICWMHSFNKYLFNLLSVKLWGESLGQDGEQIGDTISTVVN